MCVLGFEFGGETSSLYDKTQSSMGRRLRTVFELTSTYGYGDLGGKGHHLAEGGCLRGIEEQVSVQGHFQSHQRDTRGSPPQKREYVRHHEEDFPSRLEGPRGPEMRHSIDSYARTEYSMDRRSPD